MTFTQSGIGIDMRTFKFKLCLLGDGMVGKTSLLRKFVYDQFDDEYIVTFGTKTTKKVLSVQHPKTFDLVEVTFMVSDIMGQTDVRGIHDAYLYGASGGIIVCDMSRRDTLANIPNWVSKLQKVVGEVPMVFVGNKNDLMDEAQFTLEEFQDVTSPYNSPTFTTSAKTGDHVEEAFKSLGVEILKRGGRHTSRVELF